MRRNKAAVGRRPQRSKAEARRALEAVVGDDLEEVVRALVQRALRGDVAAGRLLLEHALGRPAAAPAEDPRDDPALPPELPEHVAHLL